jgi:FkbM family methyltransferase
MKEIINETLHRLGSEDKNAFVVQIGANDGICFDDTRGFLDMYKWPALLVEPIPEYFNQLKDNFKDRENYIFEQCAITDVDGPVEMLTVSQNTINDNDLHPGYKGMSALYPLKNGFGTDYERDIYVKDNLAQNIEVSGLTLDTLLTKHNIESFDVLICDAEGHDWSIFKQLDFSKYRPKFIRLEYMNLTDDEKQLVEEKLKTNNYKYEVLGQDIDAVDNNYLNNTQNDTSSLSEIIEKNASDKVISGYAHLYEQLFDQYIGKGINYLEIGLGTLDPSIPSSFCGIGAHYDGYRPAGILRAWNEYFKNATIHGFDVAEDCMIDEPGILTDLVDTTDIESVNKSKIILPGYDIILDDGLHTADGQIKTFRNFFHRVKDDGVYIIEDIGGGGEGRNVWVDYQDELLQSISAHEYFYGGNVLIIKKNNSNAGSVAFDKLISNTKPLVRGSMPGGLVIQEDPVDNNIPEPSIPADNLNTPETKVNNLTIVSGLWDIGRTGRDFSQYEEHFDRFLKIPCNMMLFVPSSLVDFVWDRRDRKNTIIKVYELEDIKNTMFSSFWDSCQAIRNDPDWVAQAGWLANSPQYKNEYYNPVVMSKMFFLHDVKTQNPFDTDYFIWLDAGITQTVYENYFYDETLLNRLIQYLDPFLFLSYPYEANTEIHGFTFSEMNKYAGQPVEYVCRGGLFGGHKDFISEANSQYWHLLNNTLREGNMGTEESIFSILAYLYDNNYRRYALADNGLIVKFIQDLDADTVKLEEPSNPKVLPYKTFPGTTSDIKTNLYFLTFNFPEQLEFTINSLEKHNGFMDQPVQKILIDNSTDSEAIAGNAKICEKYGFEHIIREVNTGINGGRQFAAEHFHDSDSDFYIFFEDDMTLSDPDEGYCRNGFRKHIPDLYLKLHQIMIKEKFDFLKLSFTEVFMDNNIQTSWYNVPQAIRDRDWPDYNTLPTTGLDASSPRTKFDTIERLEDGLAYITGDVYYANWPMIVCRDGNKKMFIDTKWAHPYEQTWMSHMYQETKEGRINPAVLLASPVTHDRFKFYEPTDRREN